MLCSKWPAPRTHSSREGFLSHSHHASIRLALGASQASGLMAKPPPGTLWSQSRGKREQGHPTRILTPISLSKPHPMTTLAVHRGSPPIGHPL